MHATRLGGLLAASLLIAASLLHPSFAQTPSSPDPALNDKAIAMLRSTTDVAQHRQAFAMLEEAEKAGDLRARANLGLGYLLGVGTPRALLESSRMVQIQETSLGTEFQAGELFGVIGDSGLVSNLWAGVSCNFR